MIERLSPLGNPERILLASDGSSFTAGARRLGIALAKADKAKLFAMTMVYENAEYAALAPESVEKAEQEAWWHLKSICTRAEEAAVECEQVLCNGEEPHAEIVEQAKDLKADLIVVGQQGRRGLARLMVGDATAKVIGEAPCPVMVVPKDGEMWEKHIVVGVDGSRHSENATLAAGNLAKRFNLPVSIVSAMVPSHSPKRHQEGKDAVDKAVTALKEGGIEADGIVADGEADQVMLQTAEDKKADLIVVGSYGRTGLGRVLLGSNTERIIGNTHYPVLVVR